MQQYKDFKLLSSLFLCGLMVIALVALLSPCYGTETRPSQSKALSSPTDSPAPGTQTHWWDMFGKPVYGGTLSIQRTADDTMQSLDPWSSWGALQCYETLFHPDWLVAPEIWSYPARFVPGEFWAGNLAESWEQTDPLTLTVHLRRGVHWQDKPPVNGREFTAEDVVFHYDRIMGSGSGFTMPSPFHAARMAFVEKAVATDKYTVEFKYKYPTAQGFLGLAEISGQNYIEPRELIKIGGPPSPQPKGLPKNGPSKSGPPKGGPPGLSSGPIQDWHNAVGTSPWILTDYVSNGSITYSKNPNYWGYDDRHPGNRGPYADELKYLIIPDLSTALAALRTGKVDIVENIKWQLAKALLKSNPEMEYKILPQAAQGPGIRTDHKPFGDVTVRKALQLAIDFKTISETHFGGIVEGMPCGIINPVFNKFGWGYEYKDWPQELKDEYSYNPAKAKELLAEAGYPDGFKTNLVAASNGDIELMQIIKGYLQDIGVDMEIRLMDPPSEIQFAMKGQHDQMIWDAMGKYGATIPPYIAIAMYYSTDMANFHCVHDPDYDAMVDQFNAAPTMDQAKQYFIKADRYALEKHYALYAGTSATYSIWQPYIRGYSGQPTFGWGGWFLSYIWKTNH